MRLLKLGAICALTILFASCEEETEKIEEGTFGTFELEFDHLVGETKLLLASDSAVFDYETGDGQSFNVTKFGYYVTAIKLEGADGTVFVDPMNASAKADEVTGYYHVLEGNDDSKLIKLSNVPSGKYNKVSFNIGIGEEGISEGAIGGILDVANGAWFWNWNAGYIGFAIEGGFHQSSHAARVAHGAPGAFAYHVGGWRYIAPADGEQQKFVNNVRIITMDFETELIVSPKHEPNAHLVVDILKVLDGANLKFQTTPSIHSPAAGKTLADQFDEAFMLDHVHQ